MHHNVYKIIEGNQNRIGEAWYWTLPGQLIQGGRNCAISCCQDSLHLNIVSKSYKYRNSVDVVGGWSALGVVRYRTVVCTLTKRPTHSQGQMEAGRVFLFEIQSPFLFQRLFTFVFNSGWGCFIHTVSTHWAKCLMSLEFINIGHWGKRGKIYIYD